MFLRWPEEFLLCQCDEFFFFKQWWIGISLGESSLHHTEWVAASLLKSPSIKYPTSVLCTNYSLIPSITTVKPWMVSFFTLIYTILLHYLAWISEIDVFNSSYTWNRWYRFERQPLGPWGLFHNVVLALGPGTMVLVCWDVIS